MTSMGHLHSRCIGVTINGHNFDTEALEFDHDLLSKLAATQDHHLGSVWGQCGTQPIHSVLTHWFSLGVLTLKVFFNL